MNQTKISAMGGLVAIFTAFLWLLPSVGETQGGPPQPFVIECPGDSIQAELDGLQPGETLTVSGTCNESVVIGGEIHGITLDGQGTATINGTDPDRSTLAVRGTDIVIKGFTITGNSHGILVNRGGVARIIDNTIENNSGNGIFVSEGSSARIGFLLGRDTVASPNLIQNNDGDGIRVQRTSSARIVGNTIRGNSDGIEVRRVSHAEISDNVIDDNIRRGINVNGNGGVDLGASSGGTIFQLPNNTTLIGRQDVGIRCRNDSYIRGRLGTLTGAGGQVDASGSCNVDVGP